MRGCSHNEVIGMHNRYLRDIGQPECYDKKIVADIVSELAGLIKSCIGGYLPVLSLADYYATRVGHSKQRFGKAITRVLKDGFDPIKDSKIKAFQKVECYEFPELAPEEDELKDPRMIMGRDPAFGLLYGRFCSALENMITGVVGFDKGKTLFDMGRFVEEHPSPGWTYYFDDASKFESSQRENLLRDVELSLWQQILLPSDFELLKRCFEVKMVKHGYTNLGMEFVFYALRCSGEVDTWLGNTILNWVAHRYFEIKHGLPKYNFIVTGDDGVGAYPVSCTPEFKNTFSEFGFDCQLDFVSDPLALEFCSSKFVEYSPGRWFLCPNIPKLLRNIGLLKNTDFDRCIGHYYFSLGKMYEIMFPNFPFFKQLSHFLMGLTRNKQVRFYTKEVFRHSNPMWVEAFETKVEPPPFSENLLLIGYYMAYGVSISQLDNLYDWFANFSVDLTGCDKRFNRRGAPAPEFTSEQLSCAEALLEKAMLHSDARVRSFVSRVRLRDRKSVV